MDQYRVVDEALGKMDLKQKVGQLFTQSFYGSLITPDVVHMIKDLDCAGLRVTSFYRQFRRSVWTPYGFRDAFNQGAQWWGPDTLGIDQGPFVLMIENYRTGLVWNVMRRNPHIVRGLRRAGFSGGWLDTTRVGR